MIGVLNEPLGFAPWSGGTTAGGSHQPRVFLHRTLTVIDDTNTPRPVLATAIPSLEQGDWRINPDGSMDQIWKLRPGLKWHDGAPLTAEDFVFGWEVLTNPALPVGPTPARRFVTKAEALDELTLALHFSAPTPAADEALFDPYPRHLLAPRLTEDVQQFPNLEFWSTGFVGAGPYSLIRWEPGALMELAAFQDYAEGRPRIDRVIFRFLGDVNTMMANILAGEIEVALPQGLSVEAAAELRSGWAREGTGNHVILYSDGRVFRFEFQHRPAYAQPAAARDPRVRRALSHALDKDGIISVGLAGLGRAADSWISSSDPRRPQFADAIPAWSYDITAAERILDEAGWRRAGDGILVHSQSGERMSSELRATGTKDHVKILAVVANDWRKLGAEVREVAIPPALQEDREYRATFPFASWTGHRVTHTWEDDRYSCGRQARAETRWSGNRNGYCNETAQPLIDRLQTTIAESERLPLQVRIMQLVLRDDYAELPVYWQTEPLVVARGVTGVGPLKVDTNRGFEPPWNAHLWDKSSRNGG